MLLLVAFCYIECSLLCSLRKLKEFRPLLFSLIPVFSWLAQGEVATTRGKVRMAMERNKTFDPSGIREIAVRLAWAQAEVFADDVDRLQLLVSGDDNSVTDLKIEERDGRLLVEQPQYGISLNLVDSHWMQLCVRIPRSFQGALSISTTTGLISLHTMRAKSVQMETVTGDMRAVRVEADELVFRAIGGDINASELRADALSVWSVNADVSLKNAVADAVKCTTVAGKQLIELDAPFQRLNLTSVSGDIQIAAPVQTARVQLRAVAGEVKMDGVAHSEDESAPIVKVNNAMAGIRLIYREPENG